MLSTTTFLTTDIMAMPLLWVIPLGLYLLSFSVAFAENRRLASAILFAAPIVLLVAGGVAMFAASRSNLLAALASVVLLFVIAAALHARMYEARPHPRHLTRFYLVMAAGGVLGGLFTALLSPLLFDWTWEHPLLILAAAALLPLQAWRTLIGRLLPTPLIARLAMVLALFVTFVGSLWLYGTSLGEEDVVWIEVAGFLIILVFAMLLSARRWAFVSANLALLLGLGGIGQLQTSFEGTRERSYFGIYSLRGEEGGDRQLMHGTTVHGLQRSGENARLPTAYYGPDSGVGRALGSADALFGSQARIGVVGLGVGTLACYRQPGQSWTFFEIDPVVLNYSDAGQFTFLRNCTPDAPTIIGDARLELENLPAASFDMLAIDAFSSDAIPLHLLTSEALDIYWHALEDDGILLMHISNRYIHLEPVLSKLAEEHGLSAAIRRDKPADKYLYPSIWVAFAKQPERLEELTGEEGWKPLVPGKGRVWSDEFASILPHIIWSNFL